MQFYELAVNRAKRLVENKPLTPFVVRLRDVPAYTRRGNPKHDMRGDGVTNPFTYVAFQLDSRLCFDANEASIGKALPVRVAVQMYAATEDQPFNRGAGHTGAIERLTDPEKSLTLLVAGSADVHNMAYVMADAFAQLVRSGGTIHDLPSVTGFPSA